MGDVRIALLPRVRRPEGSFNRLPGESLPVGMDEPSCKKRKRKKEIQKVENCVLMIIKKKKFLSSVSVIFAFISYVKSVQTFFAYRIGDWGLPFCSCSFVRLLEVLLLSFYLSVPKVSVTFSEDSLKFFHNCFTSSPGLYKTIFKISFNLL